MQDSTAEDSNRASVASERKNDIICRVSLFIDFK